MAYRRPGEKAERQAERQAEQMREWREYIREYRYFTRRKHPFWSDAEVTDEQLAAMSYYDMKSLFTEVAGDVREDDRGTGIDVSEENY